MIGTKVPIDAGTRDDEKNSWKFNDFEEIDSKFKKYITMDYSYREEGKGSNIQRAFGSIKSFKPKQAVWGYEAAASLWQFGGWYGGQTNGRPLQTTVDQSE